MSSSSSLLLLLLLGEEFVPIEHRLMLDRHWTGDQNQRPSTYVPTQLGRKLEMNIIRGAAAESEIKIGIEMGGGIEFGANIVG